MIIKEVSKGYNVYVTLNTPVELLRIEVDMEFGVNIPATGSFRKEEDKKTLVEGIELAYNLFTGKIKIE